jgi:alpha-tubulin suppressor-like RCC1 family protein
MGRKPKPSFVGAVVAALFASAAWSQATRLTYGGRLTDANGSPLAGSRTLAIRLYATGDATTPVWETQISGVELTAGGLFQVDLEPPLVALGNAAAPAWIELHDMAQAITYPRQRWASVPYAVVAASVPIDRATLGFDSSGQLTVLSAPGVGAVPNPLPAVDGAALTNINASAIRGAPVDGIAPASGYVLKWNGVAWAPSADIDTTNPGTVTSIVAGSGLAGGTITGSGTISLASTLPAVDGSALTGINAVKLQSVDVDATAPAASQILKFDGTRWAPATDANSGGTVTSITAGTGLTGGTITGSGTIALANPMPALDGGALTNVNATKIQGRSISSTAPSSGHVLKWNSSASTWEAAPDDGGVAGAISSGQNIGMSDAATADVYESTSAPNMRFRRLRKGSGVELTQTANDVTIALAADGVSAAELATDAVGSDEIAVDAVTASEIEAEAVGSAEIATDAVTAVKIAANAVGSSEIASDAVGAAEIAADAVGSSEITADAVTASEIATGAVATAEILDGTITGADVSSSASLAVASVSVAAQAGVTLSPFGTTAGNTGEARFSELTANGTNFVAFKAPDVLAVDVTYVLPEAAPTANGQILSATTTGILSWTSMPTGLPPSGTAGGDLSGNFPNPDIASNAVTTAEIAADTITAADIAAGAIDTAELAVDAVTSAKIANETIVAADIASDAVGTAELVADAVTSAKIAADTITASDIANAAVGTAELASDAVTSAKIAADTITAFDIATDAVDSAEIAADAVTNAKLADNAVNTAEIADSAVTTAKVADGTLTNADLSATAEIALTKIAAGGASVGQFLKWDGSSWVPATLPMASSSCTLGTYVIGFNADGTLQCSAQGLAFTKVSAGYAHTCAIASDNTARCFGNGGSGRLGNKSTANSIKPVAVKYASGAMLQNVIDISAGYAHSCAIVGNGSPGTQGAVWCWGYNATGQLGDASVTSRTNAVQVSGITNATQISAGQSHSCARLADGTAKCWGSGTNYRLGNGGTANATTPVTVLQAAATTMIGVAGVSAGNAYSCAWKTDGSAYCWGSNTYYQVGDGTTTQRQYAVQPTGMSTGVTKVSASYSYDATYAYAHTCAIKSAQLYCWGYGTDGQVGDGVAASNTIPTLVNLADTDDDTVADDPFTGVTDVSAAGYHTCAIADPGQTVYCWGYSADYAVTHLSTADTLRPVKVRSPDDSGWQTGATSVAASQSAVGGTYSLAIYYDADSLVNVLTGWGINTSGQLGNETVVSTGTLTPTITLSP